MTRPGLLRALCALGIGITTGVVGYGIAPATAASAPVGCTGPVQRYVVRAAGDLDAAHRAVTAAGGRVVAVQRGLGTLVAELSCPSAVRVSVAVAAVDRDSQLQKMSLGTDQSGQAGSMSLIADAIGARDLWKQGITGKGVDVAVIDTGVVPVPGLNTTDKLVLGPDLSLESQAAGALHLDTFGHGTHISGIIAGREGPVATGPVYAADTANFYGVAPDARIVSLKMADRSGAVDVSQVIAAIDWVVTHRTGDGLNVRVINLSYGTPSLQSPLLDPLSYAVEVAAKHGIVVVTSAGNEGESRQGLSNPAHDSNVIAVGATDIRGTVTPTDDVVAAFSARAGGTANPDRAPDVLAPGVSVVSLSVPGGTIAQSYPGASVGTLGIRGSGTSQAAAVVSGSVALLMQQRPDLQPPQVQDLLRSTARKIGGTSASVQGAGSIDLRAAAAAPYPMWALQGSTSTGRGTLDAARGGVRLTSNSMTLSGEVDVQGNPWDSNAMRGLTEGGITWQGGVWNGDQWTAGAWTPASGGPGGAWDGYRWSGFRWDGYRWSGTSWDGTSWASKTWTTGTWTSSGWSGATWKSGFAMNTLASKVWATKTWS
jgi:serine protease AprX